MLDKAPVLLYYSTRNNIQAVESKVSERTRLQYKDEAELPLFQPEQFLKKREGTWYSVETPEGIQYVTNDEAMATSFAQFRAGNRPELATWRDGRKVRQTFPETSEPLFGGFT